MEMDTRKARLDSILKAGAWSDEDMEWLMNELNGPEGAWVEEALRNEFMKAGQWEPEEGLKDAEALLSLLHQRMGLDTHSRRSGRVRLLARAVAVAAGLAIGVFLLTQQWLDRGERGSGEHSIVQKPQSSDPDPGADKAVLLLPDGRAIVLDTVGSGRIPTFAEGLSIQVSKGAIGFEFDGGAVDPDGQTAAHTVKTPRGGQYRLSLSDGTDVWLNSESSITFPAAFAGGERRVAITGEAYFEVAHEAGRPFLVEADGRGVVEVLGTKFNVNTYRDESHMGVTLLKGAVRFGKTGESTSVHLKPGQQAVLGGDGRLRVRSDVETGSVVAWKEGRFDFGDGMPISSAMRQISRWYDVDIRFEGAVDGSVGGSISRNVKLSRVLEMIELAGLAEFSVKDGVVSVAKPGR